MGNHRGGQLPIQKENDGVYFDSKLFYYMPIQVGTYWLWEWKSKTDKGEVSLSWYYGMCWIK